MDYIKFTDVSIFVVTLEVAIAVVWLVPLTVVFGFFLLLALGHQDESDPFYPPHLQPFINSSILISTSVYSLHLFQLIAGLLMLHSYSLMKVNLWGTVKSGWFWLGMSALTICALCFLLIKTVVDYESNSWFLSILLPFLLQKVVTSGFVLRFNVSACFYAFSFPAQ